MVSQRARWIRLFPGGAMGRWWARERESTPVERAAKIRRYEAPWDGLELLRRDEEGSGTSHDA